MADTTDFTLLKQIKEYANELERAANRKAGRNAIYEGMEDLYFMRSYEEEELKKKVDGLKLTRSPTARNAIKGMERLLIASDPVINVPSDINGNISKSLAEDIETFCKAMWFASGRISGDPIHYDAVRSALVYSTVVIAVKSTKAMLEHATGGKKRRMEYIHERTPYLFEVWNPKTVYFDTDITGLTAICRKITTLAGRVESIYGEKVRKLVTEARKSTEYNRYDEVTLSEFYDDDNHVVWIDGAEDAILMETNETEVIPVAAEIVEGSKLWEEEVYIEPPLYTLWRSRLMDRENLTLSMLYTYVFNIGANPMYVEYLNDPTVAPSVDYETPGYTIRYYANERREPMIKQAIDPSLMQGWEVSRDLGTQSTIYPQTLGEPLGKNAPYSMVALLSQAGRLPLTVVQRKASWTISSALEIALRWSKQSSGKVQASFDQYTAALDTSTIPTNVSVNAKLEIELPQDRLQAANAAAVLTQGERPIVTNAWVRENILNISGSGRMDTDIYTEQARALYFRRFIMQQMAELAQLEQMAMQQGQASGMPGMPPQNQQGMPPPMPQQPMMPGMEGEPMQQEQPYGGRFPPGAEPMPPFMPYPSVSPMPPEE